MPEKITQTGNRREVSEGEAARRRSRSKGVYKEIKAAGGLVKVQEEESARYSGMPHRAIATGAIATGAIATGAIATGAIATGAIATGAIATGFADDIVQSMRSPILVLSEAMKVLSANRAFFATFGLKADDVLAHHLYEIAGGAWNSPELRRLLEEVIPETKTIEDFCVRREFPGVGLLSVKLDARLLEMSDSWESRKILVVFDIASCEGTQRC